MTVFALFETAIGRCAIAWGARGVVALQLPEPSDAATRARLHRRLPEAREMPPPAPVQAAIDDIAALMRGERRDLTSVTLDMDGVPEFDRKVYAIARTIPPGETMTYGAIAERLGGLALARAVGQALGHNPFAIIVPCHRVLGAGGKAGGFSAGGGAATKLRMLTIERARTSAQPTLFDGDPAFGLSAQGRR